MDGLLPGRVRSQAPSPARYRGWTPDTEAALPAFGASICPLSAHRFHDRHIRTLFHHLTGKCARLSGSVLEERGSRRLGKLERAVPDSRS
jgi:hypothetical protein